MAKKLIFSEPKFVTQSISHLNVIPQINTLKFKNFSSSMNLPELEFIENLELNFDYEFNFQCPLSFLNFPNLTSLKFDFRNKNILKIIKNGEGMSFNGIKFICENKNIKGKPKKEDAVKDHVIDFPLLQIPSNVNLKEIEIQLLSLEKVEGKNELILILNQLQETGMTIILPQLGFVKNAPLEESDTLTEDGKGKEKESYISGEASKSKRRKVLVKD